MLGTKNLVLGGIHKLETVWVRGGTPTWEGLRWRRLGRCRRSWRSRTVGEGVTCSRCRGRRRSPRVVAADATAVLRKVGAVAVGPIGNVAILYVALTHPMLVASAIGWAAEQLGLNATICIFFAYFILFRLLYPFLRPLLWCAWQPVRLAMRAYSRRPSSSVATTA